MNKFPKEERLKSRKQILYLLHSGYSVKEGPIKLIWSKNTLDPSTQESSHVKIGFSVPKKKFKHAVKRNRIKRKLRESYRLNKNHLVSYLEEQNLQAHILTIYLSSDDLPYKQMEKFMVKALQQITYKLKYNNIQKYT
jgi:ribonuclease P protein component